MTTSAIDVQLASVKPSTPKESGAGERRVSGLRSARHVGGADLAGFFQRASLHAKGISRNAPAGRPVVGIYNSSGEPDETEPLGRLSGWVGGW